MPYFEPRFMPPLRGSHLFLWPFPGVWGFESSLSTPSQAAPCEAPPPGYFIPPLRGSEFGFAYGSQSVLQLPVYRSALIDKPRQTKTRLRRTQTCYCNFFRGLPLGLSPGYLLLGGSNGNNGGGGLRYLLLLLLLAGNEGGGRKGKNSDGLHNYLELVLMFEAARLPRVGRGRS